MKPKWLLCFYPSQWRQRYEAEFTALLEQSPMTVSVILDVVLGAIDAHLHFHVVEIDENRRFTMSSMFNDPTATEVVVFTRGFAQLVEEGQSLVRSLLALGNQQADPLFREAIEQVNQEVQMGQTLSRALSRHPQYFNENYVKAVRLGEISAELEIVLQRLAAGEEIDVDTETEIVLQRLAKAAYKAPQAGIDKG